MAVFFNNAITDSGTKLLAQMQTGAVFIPTKMVMGSGELPSGKTVKTITEVVSPEQEFPVSEVEKTPDESSVTISGIFSNKTVKDSFYYRELGIYAKGVFKDGTETEEVLYAYGNVGSNPDLIPAYSTETFIELILRLVVYIGNNAEVKLEVNSEAYVSSDTFKKEFATLISDETITAFALEGINITDGSFGGGSDGSGGGGEDSGGDSGEDTGDDTVEEGDVATDEEVDEIIKDIFG